jgi:transposase-like protein
MRKVPPSVMARQQINQALSEGLSAETNLLSTLAQLGLRDLLQQALEQEQEDSLGRSHYERQSKQQARRGYRNGYEEAALPTAEGKVNVRVPQVRGASTPYRSTLMEFLSGNSEALERLVVEM